MLWRSSRAVKKMAEASGNTAKIEELPRDDTTVKFKIGDPSEMPQEPLDNQDLIFSEVSFRHIFGRLNCQ